MVESYWIILRGVFKVFATLFKVNEGAKTLHSKEHILKSGRDKLINNNLNNLILKTGGN